MGLSDGLSPSDCLFIVAGTIANRKSAPVVDEWFGLLYQAGTFKQELTMNYVLQKTKIGRSDLPNRNLVSYEMQHKATALLPLVVDKANEIMQRQCDAYNSKINPQVNDEIDKLADLYQRHKQYYQLSFFENERRLSEEERRVDKIFTDFVEWVKDTLEIENNPYIRIAAVLMGVNG